LSAFLSPSIGGVWGGLKERPAFLEAGLCISLYLLILYAPPPFEEDIIMTTTIIIEVITEDTLYTLFFNIRVYA